MSEMALSAKVCCTCTEYVLKMKRKNLLQKFQLALEEFCTEEGVFIDFDPEAKDWIIAQAMPNKFKETIRISFLAMNHRNARKVLKSDVIFALDFVLD